MSSLEDMLKQRLDGGEAHEGVEIEDLWSGIEAGLPVEKDDASRPVQWLRSRWHWWLSGLLVLLILWVVGSLERSTNSSSSGSQNGIIVASEEWRLQEKPLGVKTNNSSVGGNNSAGYSAEAILPNGALRTTNNKFTSSAKKGIEKKLAKSLAKEAFIVQPAKELPILKAADRSDEFSILAGSNTPTAEMSQLKNAVTTMPTVGDKRKLYLPTFINKQEILPLVVSPGPRPNWLNKLPSPAKIIDGAKKQTRPRFEAGLFVGTNWLRQRFASVASDDLGAALNATRGQALGQSLAFEAGCRLNATLRVIAGASIARTHTTFRYTTSWDTTTLINGNVVPAVATRKVAHNNFQTLFTFPLLLEASKLIGKFETGVAAGGAFTLVSRQTGRSLNANQEVVSFGGASSAPLPIPQTYFSLMLRPQITYRLNYTFSLQARADLRWQQYESSALSGLEGGSVQIGGSVGILYGFGRSEE